MRRVKDILLCWLGFHKWEIGNPLFPDDFLKCRICHKIKLL